MRRKRGRKKRQKKGLKKIGAASEGVDAFMKFKILVPAKIAEEGMDFLRAQSDAEVDEKVGLARDEIIKIIGGYDAILTRSDTPVDAELMAAGKRLRVIARAAVGVDNIDVRFATRRGILVVNEPRGNITSAAEHTMALLLSLMRMIPRANDSLKGGRWDRHKFQGSELCGKTIGIVGLGKVGSKVAKLARGFDMRVLCYDPYILSERAESAGALLVEKLDELLEKSDIVTVHAVLNDETRGLVGPAQFGKMKNGAVVVNCARGGIVDEKALYENLQSGKVAGAAIDVWTEEPVKGGYPSKLLALENVVGTPHIGANTSDAQSSVALSIADQLVKALRGQTVSNAVNLPYILDAADFQKAEGFMSAAKVLGSILSQLGRGKRAAKITVEFFGKVPEAARKPATTFAISGFLERSNPNANAVNTMALAQDCGILVEHTASSAPTDYANQMTVRVGYSGGDEDAISGSLFSGKYLRIVGFNAIRMEAKVAPRMLWVFNRDVPGVIGAVGTGLAKNKVNIAEMSLGREREGGEAACLLAVDGEVPAAAIDGLLSDARIKAVRQISVDPALINLPDSRPSKAANSR
jgi:D-3-phosphoglycerate dehydrogenase